MKNVPNSQIGLTIHNRMIASGISPMPRNYELFYEYYVGTSSQLKKDVDQLGPHPKQSELDQIIARHMPAHIAENFASGLIKQLSLHLEHATNIIDAEKTGTDNFAEAIQSVGTKLANAERLNAQTMYQIAELVVKVAAAKKKESAKTSQELGGTSDNIGLLKQELAEYKRLASTDSMTRLKNRRAFDEHMGRLYDTGKGKRAALLVMDIDKFKQFNDTYGHPAGDRVLAIVGGVLKKNIRDAFIARTGGEEFAVVLNDVDEEATARVAERIRKAVEATRLTTENGTSSMGNVTLSIGTCMGKNANSGQHLYELADKALYTAKNNGRNRVVNASDLTKSTEPEGPGSRRFRLWEVTEEAPAASTP